MRFHRRIYKVIDLTTGGVKILNKKKIPWYAVRSRYKVELAYLFKGEVTEPYGWIEIKAGSFLM